MQVTKISHDRIGLCAGCRWYQARVEICGLADALNILENVIQNFDAQKEQEIIDRQGLGDGAVPKICPNGFYR